VLGDFTSLTGAWELTGTTATGEPFSFKLNDAAAASNIGNTPALLHADTDFTDEPVNSGGLLASLYHFRKLLVSSDDYFTEFYYLGSEPYEDEPEKAEVLITTRGTVTTRWYFRRPDGRLLGWETSLEDDAEPCRVSLGELRSFDGRQLPASLKVVHGDDTFGEFIIEAAQFAKP
jgi:hypothetical protein